MKEIIFLFGEMGTGKNYWGEKMAQEMGYTFLDGDTLVTAEMAERVGKFKPLTRQMIEDFVDRMALDICDRMATLETGLVVAQALYMREDREFLRFFLSALGYKITFVWVKTPFLRNLKQVYSRPNGLRWALYWFFNKWFFQKPDKSCQIMG